MLGCQGMCNLLAATALFFALATSACAGMPSNHCASPNPAHRVLASYACGSEELVLVDRAGQRQLVIAAQGETARQSFDDAAGAHFVLFYWAADGGRNALEFVVPPDLRAAAEVRVYDRAVGADYAIQVNDGGMWTVVGTPSSRRFCAPHRVVADAR